MFCLFILSKRLKAPFRVIDVVGNIFFIINEAKFQLKLEWDTISNEPLNLGKLDSHYYKQLAVMVTNLKI